MIVQTEFLKKIKDFGLNSYEAKIWTALLSRGVSTAGELSDIANVPRSRSYDILESLERKGFIVMKIGKPIQYLAISPSEVLERVKKKINEDAQKNIDQLDKVRSTEILNELNLLHKKGIELVEPFDITGAIKGRDNIYDHIELMIKDAQEEILLVTSEAGFIQKSQELNKALKKAHDRGIQIRIAAPLTKKAEKEIKVLTPFSKIRVTKGLNARFCIIDKKEIAFMLTDHPDIHPN
ncbi:MAG TPA: helix-turn-helix domain-containing protein, partial [Candidatus Nanoarchaeia archaeon]|nr:helix-turn-helix domain-containing protein [Candidatus Nanoarchaeia archaeon]